LADSGNGGHVLIRVDLPNDDGSKQLVRQLLRSLADRFGDDEVAVDVAVSNAARITKLYGTLARKGNSTTERPYRCSGLLEVPDCIEPAPRAVLEAIARVSPERANGHTPAPALPIPDVIPESGGADPRGIGRNSTLTRLAGLMRRQGMTAEEMFPSLCVTNERRCVPPLSEEEVRRIATSIGRYESGETRARTAQPDEVLPFPTDALPGLLQILVREGAEAYAAPPDFIGLPQLVTAGAAIGCGLEIEVKRGWREGTNLYAANVGSPGSRKTPALNLTTKWLQSIQQRLNREYHSAQAIYESNLADWESTPRAERRGRPKPQPPVYGHVITTDATVEALAPMLATAGSILLIQDELAGWFGGMNQYRGGGAVRTANTTSACGPANRSRLTAKATPSLSSSPDHTCR